MTSYVICPRLRFRSGRYSSLSASHLLADLMNSELVSITPSAFPNSAVCIKYPVIR